MRRREKEKKDMGRRENAGGKREKKRSRRWVGTEKRRDMKRTDGGQSEGKKEAERIIERGEEEKRKKG